jgi:hypothetical protein
MITAIYLIEQEKMLPHQQIKYYIWLIEHENLLTQRGVRGKQKGQEN